MVRTNIYNNSTNGFVADLFTLTGHRQKSRKEIKHELREYLNSEDESESVKGEARSDYFDNVRIPDDPQFV